MGNKIKYNLRKVHYAKITESVTGNVTFEKPVPIPGSVSMSLEAQGETSKFYADGIVYYKASSNNGYEGDLEVALVPESFCKDILGEAEDEKKVLIENADAKQSAFALLFEFEGDKNATRRVLYNCTATRPSLESKTREENIDPVTEKLTITATPLPDGRVKATTSSETDPATYENWYNKVYETEAAAG